MTGYGSGMIGLLASWHARITTGLWQGWGIEVGLITGEERIVPPGASYLCCTVDQCRLAARCRRMTAAKELRFRRRRRGQLAGDRERGHVFTDRILHARGIHETMFLGAETAGPLLRRMFPEARFESRRRLSTPILPDRRS